MVFQWVRCLTAIEKTVEWTSKIQCTQSKTSGELSVGVAIVAQGEVAANVTGEGSVAGISDVDSATKGWVNRKRSITVGVELSTQVDRWVDRAVISDLNVGGDTGVDLTSSRVNIESQLGRNGEIGVAPEHVEGDKT